MKNLYDNGWKMIIKPRQFEYDQLDLGQPSQIIKETLIHRLDFGVRNPKGYLIKGSLFYSDESRDSSPCIMYCHSHNGNRCEGLEMLKFVVPDFNFCVFDYSGSGMSQGEYVTLGILEQFDVKAVIGFLAKKYRIKDFFLWGRSMGAVSVLLFCEKFSKLYRIRGLVLDSPFKDSQEMVSNIYLLLLLSVDFDKGLLFLAQK